MSETVSRREVLGASLSTYLLATLGTAAAFALRMALAGDFSPPFILFLPVVVLAAVLGGIGPGLLATGLSTTVVALWVIPSEHPQSLYGLRESTSTIAFVLLGAVTSVVAQRYRTTRQRMVDLERSAALLSATEKARTSEELLRKTESEARIGRAELEAVFRAVSDRLMVFDMSGDVVLNNEDEKQLQVARSVEPSARWSLAYFASSFELFSPEGAALPLDQWPASRVLRGESVADCELDGRWKHNGQRFVFAFRGEPVRDGNGRQVLAVLLVRDVTDRRRADDELRASEARLQLFVAHTPAAVAMFDRDMRYLAVSRRFISDYHLRESDLVGRSHYEIFPDVPARWREIHQRCLGGAVESCDEEGFRRADGTTDWIRWELRPWRTAAGAIGGLVLFSENITDRKRAAEHLAAEKERLAVTLRSIGDAVIATDDAGRITMLNPVAEKLTGWRTEHAAGMAMREVVRLIGEETRQRVVNPVDRVLADGAVVGPANHTLLIARDGTELPIADSAAPIRDAAGVVMGAVMVFRDQTGQRAVERALQKSEKRFRLMIEKSSDVVVVLDSDMRVAFWSPSAVEQFGWTAEEALGRPGMEFIHPDDRPQLLDARWQLVEKAGGTTRDVRRQLCKDGSYRVMEAVVRNLLHEPAIEGLVVNMRDISEQRQLTEQFQQAQKLESVGRLAGGVAHDFNNLLTVILNCSFALKEDLQSGVAPSLEDVEFIHEAGERARDLTRQLLAFARKQVIAPEVLDLNEVVRGTQKMMQRLIGEDVELGVTLQPGLWSVHCDAGQIEQVILNLAVNARDAMPRGGRLTIETGNFPADRRHDTVCTGMPGDWVRLVVRDTGGGIPPEIRAHLFEPFFTTKERGKGTGLGLATVYGIVNQAGGHIHVDSEPGRGAAFVLCFPRHSRPARRATQRVPPTSVGGSETLLVVEDDPQVREITLRLLRAGGYDVLVAPHPEAALALAPDDLSRVRLLISDVVMPGLDGRALSEELVRRNPTMKVLYVSGYTQDAIADRGVIDSGIEFLAKPFSGHVLLTRVRAILDAVPAEPEYPALSK